MQRLFLILCLAGMAVLPVHALPPLTFEQFSALNPDTLEPYIVDYFKRYPEQKGCEPIIRDFFSSNPPATLMPALEKQAPIFYAGIKSKAEAAQKGQKKSNYSLDDFLKLPEAEHRYLAGLTGPYLHKMLTNDASNEALQKLVHKENRALEMAYMLVQMRAQQSTPAAFSDDLLQIMTGLSQVRQAAGKVN